MVRVLTIGNSFSRNATRYLEEMTDEIVLGRADFGGCSLEKHWNVVTQCDLLPDVKPYDFQLTGQETPVNMNLREILAAEPWDFVTLQQVSRQSWLADTFEPFFGNLHALVRDLAPQAQPAIHQTWAYRIDSPQMAEWEITQQKMFEDLKANYAAMAGKYELPILPSGEAFQKARKHFRYRVDGTFDFENPKPLTLPDQTGSLNVGWHWRTGNTASGNAELHIDANHGNAYGCYLGNCVWYEAFTGSRPSRSPFVPEQIPAADAAALQHAAHQAVEEYGGPLV
ncbi:MAG: DUF4886 domain-containing protein [Kiritimatiellae bacterium]|nr:DUF4886 domain-containing protein [Kiritimatiellia bacterium]